MTKSLLLGLAALAALPLGAQTVTDAQIVSRAAESAPTRVATRAVRAAAPAAAARQIRHLDASLIKRRSNAAVIAPHALRARAASAAVLPEGSILFESFEGWDGETAGWVPEGWTVESHGDATLEAHQKWSPTAPSYFLPAATDGNYTYGISFAYVQQDEWLITPEVTLPESQVLTFDAYIDPMFLFSLENVDWNEMTFIGDPVIAATLKVLVKPQGGEWTPLWDAADDYMEMTVEELMMLSSPGALYPHTVSLAEYAGQTVQVAFQYVGIDGNTMLIDAVNIGYPALDEVAYMNPFSTLYWGYSNEPGWPSLTVPLALYPALSPITWTNNSPYYNATYTWTYCDGITAEWVTSDNQDELTETYLPDYSSAGTMKNNLFYPPVLTASMPGAADGSFQAPYRYFQAGGTAEMSMNDGTEFVAGLLPFEQSTEGLTFLTSETDFGEMDTPITGYNSKTDDFWYAYTFPGEDDPSYGSYVDGILNFIYTTSTPLVVDGATVLARGADIDPEVEMTLAIYPLNDDFTPDLDHPVVSSTLKAEEFIAFDSGATLLFYSLDFNFEQPAVLSDEKVAYIVMLTGFHDPRVGYFAPMQSKLPNPDYLCFGYLSKKNKFLTEDYEQSYMPLAYIEGEYGDCYNAFAINLKGHYGWLGAGVEEITVPANGSVNMAIDTYFPEERVSVSELAGVAAEYSGRYNTGNLVLTRDNAVANPADGVITVSTPGHSVDINVHFETSGIQDATISSDAEIEAIYNAAGVRMATDAVLAPGVYVVRRTDGTVSKMVR